MVISARLQIHAVIHPVLAVRRDAAGKLQSFGGDTGTAESVMHFEIDRVADAAEQAQLIAQVEAALDAASAREAGEFLRWIAADNFTFFGYREYEVADADGERVLRAVDGSGL